MSRVWIVVLVLVALAAIVLFTADPLGFFGDPIESTDDVTIDPLDDVDDAKLRGRYVAPPPGAEPKWFEGERVGSLRLKAGTSALTGVVTGGGEPLYAARVRVVLPGEAGEQAVRTRSDGTWEVKGLPAGSHEVRATHVDHSGRTVVAPAVADDATLDVGAIDLEPRRTYEDGFRIRVTDEFGRPIVGAKVLATTLMWSLHLAMGPQLAGMDGVLERSATTDEQGEAALLKLAPEAYDVVVFADGFQTTSQAQVMAAEGRVKHLRFALKPAASISGLVVDTEGKPIGGAFVFGMHQPSFASSLTAQTSKDGRFVLGGLREGNYMVIVGHDDYGEAVINPTKSPGQGLRIQLRGAGKLEVRVTRPNGEPVPRYHVRPYRGGPFAYTFSMRFDVENEEGRHTMSMSPGSYNLAVKSPSGDFSTDTQATVRVGETTSVTVVLPASVTVEGVVTDPEGRHLADAEVYVKKGGFPEEPNRELYSRTDANGRFRITGLPAEKVGLHARHARFAATVTDVDATTAAEEAKELTIRLSAGGRLEGRVLQGEDEPVVGETVSLMPGFNFFDARSTVTDAEGRYRFEALPGGTYTVSTGPMEPQSGGVSKGGVEVPAEGGVTVDLRMTDPEAQGVVVGTVTRGGLALEGADVMVIDARGWGSAVEVRTDATGQFRAEGVVVGGAQVRVSSPGGVVRTRGVQVPEEGEVQVTVDFGIGGLRGRLEATDGAPISGAWIQIEALDAQGGTWGRMRAQTTSAADGTFESTGLEPGSYRVRATQTGYAGLVSDPVAVTADGVVDAGTFRLSAGMSLQGRIVDDAGTPVEDATISLKDESGRPVFLFSLVTTGSDGRYEMAGLEPGRYVVGFEAKGYAPAAEEVELIEGGATVDAVLYRGGAVEVFVADGAGAPIPGVRVVLLDARGAAVERTLSLVSIADGDVGRTGEDGRTRIPDLAPGYYTVTVNRSGWEATGDWPGVNVQSGGRVSAEVQLAPK